MLDELTFSICEINKSEKHARVGFGAKFTDNLSYGFHDYGVLWTPKELIFEVDGEPVSALVTNDVIKGPADIRLSAALADWAGGSVPEHPERHGMVVKSFASSDSKPASSERRQPRICRVNPSISNV